MDFVPGSKYMADKIPGARLVEIPGAGHAPNLSHPDLFDQCLRTFLDEVAARAATVTASPSVTVGIHLPQAGPAASGEALRQAAVLAEQLGFSDVWLSDHLLVPTGADYPPSAYVLEPLASMAWVAAVTTTVRIGTSILVLPMRNPIEVAKSLATIDQFSVGRVVLGTAAGWLEKEFDALGMPFHERGARMDEALEMLRMMWTEDDIADLPGPRRKIRIHAGQATAGGSSAHLDWWAWKDRHPKSDQHR